MKTYFYYWVEDQPLQKKMNYGLGENEKVQRISTFYVTKPVTKAFFVVTKRHGPGCPIERPD